MCGHVWSMFFGAHPQWALSHYHFVGKILFILVVLDPTVHIEIHKLVLLAGVNNQLHRGSHLIIWQADQEKKTIFNLLTVLQCQLLSHAKGPFFEQVFSAAWTSPSALKPSISRLDWIYGRFPELGQPQNHSWWVIILGSHLKNEWFGGTPILGTPHR